MNIPIDEAAFLAWLDEVMTDEVPDEPQGREFLVWLTHLSNHAEAYLGKYSRVQVGKGLWRLISNLSPLPDIFDPATPRDVRLNCLRSFWRIFEYFDRHCLRQTSHNRDEIDELNAICYMWWDCFPSWGHPDKPEMAEMDDLCLKLMEAILRLPNPACQESALHGLSHWHLHYPERCAASINEYLVFCNDDELQAYAEEAREGGVQ
jgi:hypothetical protein